MVLFYYILQSTMSRHIICHTITWYVTYPPFPPVCSNDLFVYSVLGRLLHRTSSNKLISAYNVYELASRSVASHCDTKQFRIFSALLAAQPEC